MNVLAFDTATAASSACLLRADGRAFESTPPPARLLEPPAHARELMPAVARVMEEAGVGWGDLGAIAPGAGPGTFTGLRIGFATARALSQASGVPLRPVSSLAGLAAGIEAPLRLALIDARRGEVFAGLYGEDGPVWEAFAATPAELAARLAAVQGEVVAAGDGSLRFREVLEAAGARVEPADSPVHAVRALHLARLAAAVPDTPPEAALPDYLRVPDATPR